MSRGERAVLGIVLMAGGLLGLLIYVAWFTMWVYPMFPTAHMMGGWNYGELEELTGKVEKIGWMEIELRVNGKIVEVHGPLWNRSKGGRHSRGQRCIRSDERTWREPTRRVHTLRVESERQNLRRHRLKDAGLDARIASTYVNEI